MSYFAFIFILKKKIIKIIFIEIFDYQIAENKDFNVCQIKNLNFQLLMKRLIKKKLLMQSNLQKIIYNINNDRFVFNDDKNLQTLFKFQHLINLSHANVYIMTDFDFR